MNLYDTGRITTLSARTERNRGERFRALFTKNCFFREHMNKLCKKSDRMKKGIREEGNPEEVNAIKIQTVVKKAIDPGLLW